MKYYLSGPTTGIPESNLPAFQQASERLREAGYEVYSPAEGSTSNSPTEAMRANLGELLTCDAVIVLPVWGRSEEAKIEIAMARAIGLPIHAYHQHRPKAQMIETLGTVKIVTRAEIVSD